MSEAQRRAFLKTMAAGSVGISAAMQAHEVKAEGEKPLVIGLIGPGGMGSNHLNLLCKRQDVELAYICDVDQNRLATAVKKAEAATKKTPKGTQDLREVLADKRVDAVFIATPDHWHGPAAILALDAGKHVYVEKPCCHNIREGRLMADAVARSGKVLQVGTQSRSTGFVREAIERVHKGEIGEVLVAKAWNSQRRGTIGKGEASEPPSHLDYDTWLGPAPQTPYRANALHGVWRWWHAFGCGDIGNDGVHDIDVALWGLGVTTHPSTVTCLGGKYFFDDDQQYPDTQYAICEYPMADSTGRKKQLIFEQRIWSPYVQEGYENGAAFYGTNGVLILGHSVGWKLYGPRNKLIAEGTGSGDVEAHHQNFFDCIRGKQKVPHADIQVGLRAAGIVHLANIAARTGAVLHFDPQAEKITNHEEANSLVRRKYREGHWSVPKNV